MAIFKLNNEFKPAGDQPQAIDRLVEGLRQGQKFQTLMGVTGSGKTFTMANVIAQFDLPPPPPPPRPASPPATTASSSPRSPASSASARQKTTRPASSQSAPATTSIGT